MSDLILSAEVDQLFAAVVDAQHDMPVVPKTAKNPFFNSAYAPLDAIVGATKDVLHKHGLAVVQLPGHGSLFTLVVHRSGQYVGAEMSLAAAKDDPQGQGSAISYAKRYAMSGALRIVTDEDDDGNAAQQTSTAQPRRTNGSAPRSGGDWEGYKAQHQDVDWARLANLDNAFVQNVLTKGEHYGSLTDKQLDAIVKVLADA